MAGDGTSVLPSGSDFKFKAAVCDDALIPFVDFKAISLLEHDWLKATHSASSILRCFIIQVGCTMSWIIRLELIPSRSVPSDVLDERTSAPHVSLEGRSTEARKALIFTKMEDYVHDSTPAMASCVLCKLQEFGWKGVVTDDKDFLESEEKLSAYDLVVFLNNSGQIFDKTEALMKHIEQGKGVVGVHAAIAAFLNGKDASGATVMEPTSEIFHTIFGSHFKNYPPVQKGKVSMNFKNDLGPNLVSVPSEFMHTDEFFNFTKNVYDDPSITVVASLDESTTDGGLMGERHPLAWYRNIGEQKAPVFYSALGHFSHFYNGTGGADSEYVTTILEAGLRYCCDNS